MKDKKQISCCSATYLYGLITFLKTGATPVLRFEMIHSFGIEKWGFKGH
jgi:hypothetical protein